MTWAAPAFDGGVELTDYVIQRSPNGVDGWTTIADAVGLSTSLDADGLTPLTRYYFRVLAVNDVGTGPPSNVANAVPRGVPSAPRTLAATPTNQSGRLQLTWLAPASNGGAAIADYVIQRSPNGTSGWTTVSDGVSTATAYTVTGLTNGVRYYFRIFARNAAGNSAASAVVERDTADGTRHRRVLRRDRLVRRLRPVLGRPDEHRGSPITGFVIQAFDYTGGSWFTVGIAAPSWNDAFVSAPGEGCATSASPDGTQPASGRIADRSPPAGRSVHRSARRPVRHRILMRWSGWRSPGSSSALSCSRASPGWCCAA